MQAWLQSIAMENVNDDIFERLISFLFWCEISTVEKVFLSIFSASGISLTSFFKLNGICVVIRVKFNRRRVYIA